MQAMPGFLPQVVSSAQQVVFDFDVGIVENPRQGIADNPFELLVPTAGTIIVYL
ncbi:MAG: hypothetical protein H6559_34430 [Lewinellaceae bacterium]|nr:hypothetical protein [Lewinellaceae bacterium]